MFADKKYGIAFAITSLILSSLVFFIDFRAIEPFVMKGGLFILLSWTIYRILDFILRRFIWKNTIVPLRIVDSSAFIDGRIMEIIESNFMDGTFVIPCFVLAELHRLSDSESAIKRLKGRRALDFVNAMLKSPQICSYIDSKDYKETRDVDSKIVLMAKERGAKILTTDYNLSKVAKIQGISVMNINKLANIMKSTLLPDEEIEVDLLKKGDKDGQAIGYLEDGTMLIVENGARKIGRKIRVHVTSTYPTPAGKMIFAKIK